MVFSESPIERITNVGWSDKNYTTVSVFPTGTLLNTEYRILLTTPCGFPTSQSFTGGSQAAWVISSLSFGQEGWVINKTLADMVGAVFTGRTSGVSFGVGLDHPSMTHLCYGGTFPVNDRYSGGTGINRGVNLWAYPQLADFRRTGSGISTSYAFRYFSNVHLGGSDAKISSLVHGEEVSIAWP